MMVVRNAGYTKDFNQRLILRLLSHNPLSRADIARRTGLSKAAISLISEEMVEAGLIEETVPQNIPKGRRPILMALAKDQLLAAGVYLSRTSCRIGIVNLGGDILAHQEIQLARTTGVYEALDKIADIIKSQCETIGIPHSELMGVGFSAPGPVDASAGQIMNPPDFERWHYTSIKTHLENQLGLIVLLENNSYTHALYEKNNIGVPNPTFLYLLVDCGVGSGFISKGRLYRGIHGLSGELGHMSINQSGPPCSCGNRGCLELYASIPSILKQNHSKDEWLQVSAEAKRGDVKALSILQQEARYLAAGIINAVNMLDINTVMLGGDIMEVYELIAPMIRQRVNQMSLISSFEDIKVLPSHPGWENTIAASANIIYEDYFSDIVI